MRNIFTDKDRSFVNIEKKFSKSENLEAYNLLFKRWKINKIPISIIKKKNILDVGCGSGRYSWALKKLGAKKVIGIDVDSIVLENKSTDNNIVYKDTIPLEDNSVDLIIMDWVLEHINDTTKFYSEINRILKINAIICARTPNFYSYWVMCSKIIPRKMHELVIKKVQDNRKEIDVFPAFYKLNTLKDIKKKFEKYENYIYLETPDPTYYFNNKIIYNIMQFLHKLLPKSLTSVLFVFLKKKIKNKSVIRNNRI
jgi:ubiquinone/menaquinone biosynthesis C-methylase UbiE